MRGEHTNDPDFEITFELKWAYLINNSSLKIKFLNKADLNKAFEIVRKFYNLNDLLFLTL